jgi:hypothetical protein
MELVGNIKQGQLGRIAIGAAEITEVTAYRATY